MKKILVVMLAAMLVLSGCGKKKANDAANTEMSTETAGGDMAQNTDNSAAAEQAKTAVEPKVDEAIVY